MSFEMTPGTRIVFQSGHDKAGQTADCTSDAVLSGLQNSRGPGLQDCTLLQVSCVQIEKCRCIYIYVHFRLQSISGTLGTECVIHVLISSVL